MSGMGDSHVAPARSGAAALGILVIGALVAVALGVYGRVHTPTGQSITTLGFSDLITMKVSLAVVAGVLALAQLVTALRLFGHLGRGAAPRWVGPLHRTTGAAAILITVPVAYHCLWSLGFQYYDTRVLVHSLAGCLVYGALVAKLAVLHSRRMPKWALPVAAGTLFTVLVVAVLTSAVWYLTSQASY